MTPDYSIVRYADSTIDGKPERFDAIEVRGVVYVQTGAYSFTYAHPDAGQEPTHYLLGLHVIDESVGGCESIGEFTRKEDALAYAAELAEEFGWVVND